MVYSNESMTDKNKVEVNHFEPAPPMHDEGGIQEKNTPRALANDQLKPLS
jgi:hypothetical protein